MPPAPTTPLIVFAISGLIDDVQRSASNPTDVWPSIVPWLAILLVASIIRSLDGALGDYLSQLTGLRLGAAVQHMVCAKAVALPLSVFEREEYYTKLEVAGKEGGSILSDFLENVSWLATSLVGAAGLMVLFFRAHWLIGVALVTVMGVRGIVQSHTEHSLLEVDYQNSPRRREKQYWSRLLTSREAIPEIRLSGLSEFLLRRRHSVFQHFLVEIVAAQRKVALPGLGSVAAQEAVAFIIVFALLIALVGNITLGSLVALLYGLTRFRDLADNVAWGLRNMSTRSCNTREYLRDFLALEAETPDTPENGPRIQRPLREGIQFREVSFTYPGANRPALANINLEIRPGERIALVGENGAGKTTLVRLLLGLYRPTQGTILVDGRDLSTLDPEAWRREATAVFQDFVRYPTTVFENIAFGDPALLAASPQAATRDPSPHRRGCGAERGGRFSSPLCPQATRRHSAKNGQVGRICLPASGSGWPWRGRICAMPKSSLSMSLPPPWTRGPRWNSTGSSPR